MSTEEIRDFLVKLDLCTICIHRYLNEYENILKATDDVTDLTAKRTKPNICIACLGVFEDIGSTASEVIANSTLQRYDCDSLYSSIQIPVSLFIRELSIWIALIKQFPGKINDDLPPSISIKDAFKMLFNKRLCAATNRILDYNQKGLLVNVFYDYDKDNDEIQQLAAVKPHTLSPKWMTQNKSKNISDLTRNFFEKHFYPKNLNLDEYVQHVSVPPKPVTTKIKLTRYAVCGPTIFLAGRYRKLSRDLSQTPWILDGKRMKEDSLQEIISRELFPYFETEYDKITFMGSGREDIDVRCLGKGRPFALQVSDAKKSSLPKPVAAEIEMKINHSKQVSVQHLQMVNREDLIHIKSGEEHKRKFYRALCVLSSPITGEVMSKLDILNGCVVQQQTPIRVLHRRPLLTRPREIFSIKGYISKENQNVIILDIVTQAGTYIKELVHGDFGRTSPSVSSIIGQVVDIIALDVSAVELDWPKEV